MIGNKKHYLIAGATGLIGKQLVQRLINDESVGKVSLLVRNGYPVEHAKLSLIQVNWDEMTESVLPQNVDAVFCCLGTTMKKAGSRDAFRKVDYEYVMKLAVFTQRKKIAQFHVISANGANESSRVFYSKVKGRMELELQKLTGIRSIFIYRPSMLLGNREEFRLGETLGKIIMKAVDFMTPARYKAVYDVQVAMVMQQKASEAKKGVFFVENDELHQLT